MKRKLFVPFTSKTVLSFVALFVRIAMGNASEPETPIIDVHFRTQLF